MLWLCVHRHIRMDSANLSPHTHRFAHCTSRSKHLRAIKAIGHKTFKPKELNSSKKSKWIVYRFRRNTMQILVLVTLDYWQYVLAWSISNQILKFCIEFKRLLDNVMIVDLINLIRLTWNCRCAAKYQVLQIGYVIVCFHAKRIIIWLEARLIDTVGTFVVDVIGNVGEHGGIRVSIVVVHVIQVDAGQRGAFVLRKWIGGASLNVAICSSHAIAWRGLVVLVVVVATQMR